MTFDLIVGSAWPSLTAIEKACSCHGQDEVSGDWKLATTATSNNAACLCCNSAGCSFAVRAQRVFTATGNSRWRLTHVNQRHIHAAPLRPPLPPQIASQTTNHQLDKPKSFAANRVRPNYTGMVKLALPLSHKHMIQRTRPDVLTPTSPSQMLVSSPEASVKPTSFTTKTNLSPETAHTIPSIGDIFPSREAFKEHCQRAADACRPRFQFATTGSNNSIQRRFLMYSCRQNGGPGHKRVLGCPYMIRIEVKNPEKSDSEWIVTDACYEHARHRCPSPPLRRPAWTRQDTLEQKRIKAYASKPYARPSTVTRVQRRPKGRGRSVDVSSDHEEGRAQEHCRPRAAPSTASNLAMADFANAPKCPTQPPTTATVDTTQPLEAFIAQLHPLLCGHVASSAATALRQAGVEDTVALLTLLSDEITLLVKDSALKVAHLAVLRHRISPYLSCKPAYRKDLFLTSIPQALALLHPSMYAAGTPASIRAVAALKSAGIETAELFESLSKDELVEVLDGVEGLRGIDKAVIACRAGNLA